MQERSPFAAAHQSIVDGVAALRAACDSRADADTRIAALSVCEELTRQLERVSVELTAGLDRDGVFSDRGYHSPALALADLIGCDTGVARRRMRAAEQVVARVGLDGQVLPARLPETAAVFAAGQVGLRHVEVIAEALASPAAQRLTPEVWAGAEQQLADARAAVPAAGARSVRSQPDRGVGPGRPTTRRARAATGQRAAPGRDPAWAAGGSKVCWTRRPSTRWPARSTRSPPQPPTTTGPWPSATPTRSANCAPTPSTTR